MTLTLVLGLCASLLGSTVLAGLAARAGLPVAAPWHGAPTGTLGLLTLALLWPLHRALPGGVQDTPLALLAALLTAAGGLELGRLLGRRTGGQRRPGAWALAVAATGVLLAGWWLMRPARLPLPGTAGLGTELLPALLAAALVPVLALLTRPGACAAVRWGAALVLGLLATAGASPNLPDAHAATTLDPLLVAALVLLAWVQRRPREQALVASAEAPPVDPGRAHLDRSGFERCLRQAHQDGQPFALLHIAVEPPALAGPSAAELTERLLDKAAQRLRALLGGGDALGRMGDRHFLLLAAGVAGPSAVDGLAQRAIQEVGRPVRKGPDEWTMGCTVGSVTGPGLVEPPHLVGCSEQALRQARQLGQRHRAFEGAGVRADGADRELLQALREALSGDGLSLQFQPKVDTRSGRVSAVEALLRWEHPQRGRISPAEFVPLAERHGLIGALGDWVIEAACRQSRQWREKGLHMRVAINVSPHQMQQPDLAQRLQAALQRHGVAPQLVTCEITESAAMQDTQVTQQIFQHLRELGVSVSIDDFGTGYSSLAYLRKLPAEELKIDRAFVTDLAHSADARAVVDAVVRLAHALGLHVVAEGVETEEQRRLLTELGCDQLQGYLLARPMSGQGLLLWALHDRRHDNAFESALYDATTAAAQPTRGRRRASA